jgi:esterase/lipase superfamily enzyme
MTDDTIKRANFGFDVDFDDLSTVKPTGRNAAKAPTTKSDSPALALRPKAVSKTTNKKPRKAKAKPMVRKTQDELADRLARSQGFTSREAVSAAPVLMKKRRRVQHDEPVDQLSIRGPVRVLNGFIDYCEENKLSYWEGMERLVAQSR